MTVDSQERSKYGKIRDSFLALVVLSSGLVNLYSVAGKALPGRLATLRELFPLVFVHLSRFVTLLIGFTLVVLSINIYKRKKELSTGAFAFDSIHNFLSD